MQADGNFVSYGPDEGFIDNTGSVSPGSRLVTQTDGNLVIRGGQCGDLEATLFSRERTETHGVSLARPVRLLCAAEPHTIVG